MAVRGLARRVAELTRAGAGLATAILVAAAGCALIGVGIAGAGGAVVGLVVAAILVVIASAWCGRLALSALAARPVSEVEQPQLYRLVRELSGVARLPVPRLYLSPERQPNAFTAGRGSRTARLCCTDGLLRLLDETELRGVLAQQLGHVAGHDVLASCVAAGLVAGDHSYQAIEAAIVQTSRFLNSSANIAVSIESQENGLGARVRTKLQQLGFRIEAGARCRKGFVLAAHRQEFGQGFGAIANVA